METDLLTSTQAAEVLHLTVSGFRRLVRAGKIPARRLQSGQYVFLPADVAALAAERAQSPEAVA